MIHLCSATANNLLQTHQAGAHLCPPRLGPPTALSPQKPGILSLSFKVPSPAPHGEPGSSCPLLPALHVFPSVVRPVSLYPSLPVLVLSFLTCEMGS